MDESRSVFAVLRAALRSERKAFIQYVVALSLSIAAVQLGESRSLWWYLLAAPLAWMVLRQIPGSVVERRMEIQEHARAKAIAKERGHARHARRGDRVRIGGFSPVLSALGGSLAAFFIWMKWDRPWEALGVGVAVALAYWVLG